MSGITRAGSVKAADLSVSVDGHAWAGIFCMHALDSHRRRGNTRRILGALASWALNKGAANMYVQVKRDNLAAWPFYEAAGFVTQYGYHYRTKESGRASQ